MTSAAEEYYRTFSKDEVNSMPLFRYEGQIVLVRTTKDLAAAFERIAEERLLGFDTESKPCFRKGMISPPTLMQIACSDVVFLIQLNWLPFNEAMASFLANPEHIKTGVAIGDDIRMLNKIHPFTAAGLVDLRDVARTKGLATRGLRTMAANFLHMRISKSAQCSNWGNKELSPQQVVYAATDAWVSRLVYERMSELGFFAEATTFSIDPEEA
ncbi:3'-5' exonuclease domain-containing protein 2 [Desulfovibrio sp. OttesenSCG-928-O18]|nr:3'-5' exonuclease domain-containing protein 2 [Desulfovibrio sp. OttesenSCG-928-O18]